MARWPTAEAVYEAADLFRQRCLVEGHSFLWPDHPAWTIDNIDALLDAFMGHADYGNGSFLEKLHDQLAEQPDDILRVAADILAFYFLFPGSATVGRDKKLASVQAILDWRPDSLTMDERERRMLTEAFAEGIGNTGTFYLSGRPWHLTFLLTFARGVLEGKADPYDPVACKRLIEEMRSQLDGRIQSRHILLHLLFQTSLNALPLKRTSRRSSRHSSLTLTALAILMMPSPTSAVRSWSGRIVTMSTSTSPIS